MPHIAVYEVATFYSMYDCEPVGRHKIKICGSVSCLLSGANDLIAHIKEKYNIDIGGTTKDERYTLKRVKCLGACVDAPVVQIAKTYHAKQTPEKLGDVTFLRYGRILLYNIVFSENTKFPPVICFCLAVVLLRMRPVSDSMSSAPI